MMRREGREIAVRVVNYLKDEYYGSRFVHLPELGEEAGQVTHNEMIVGFNPISSVDISEFIIQLKSYVMAIRCNFNKIVIIMLPVKCIFIKLERAMIISNFVY